MVTLLQWLFQAVFWVLFCSSASSSSSSTASEINLEQCDSRAEVLKEDMKLASVFIKTLFAVLYEVYSSSVSGGGGGGGGVKSYALAWIKVSLHNMFRFYCMWKILGR